MKKILIPLLVAAMGMALLLMSDVFGSWLDRMLHADQISLSEAFLKLAEGDMEAHEKALSDFILAGRGKKPLRALALYNLGNCALAKAGRGDPIAAKDALFYFKEALRNDPLLFPAKFNLEILMKSAKENEKAGAGEPEPGLSEPSKKEDEEKREKQLVSPPPFLGSSP